MSTPQDVKARVAAAYNSAADYYDNAANAFWDRYGRQTVERLGIEPGAKVLDVCCGTGASALPAALCAGSDGHVIGVDLAEALIGLARTKTTVCGLTNVDFRVGDVLDMDLHTESFDFVVCVFGIFFMPDMPRALKTMWSYVRPGGCLAVTTWGRGVFEPVNSWFWNAVRTVRPDLYKGFNAWDRLGEPALVQQLFSDAGLPAATVTLEPGVNPTRIDSDVVALLMGSGYRGTLDVLSPRERLYVLETAVVTYARSGITDVRTDVIYATCRKPEHP